MLKKTYTCNLIKGGKVIGSGYCEIWFFMPPSSAWEQLNNISKSTGNLDICDFRRVK